MVIRESVPPRVERKIISQATQLLLNTADLIFWENKNIIKKVCDRKPIKKVFELGYFVMILFFSISSMLTTPINYC